MWHALIALALLSHAVGHAVGVLDARAGLVPALVAGAGAGLPGRRLGLLAARRLVAGGGGGRGRRVAADRAPGPRGLRLGPYGSAFVLDALTVLVLLVPYGRRVVTAL
jgi:hypothetical protein